MKKLLIVIRWIVGLLFIFSGLVKANDPLGLSYKMQEFFEVWGLSNLNEYTLSLSLIMNVFEVLAGVAVIIGWRMKLFSWLLLLLIIFFSFLTGYAALSGKIKTCGCFGDCLPLTPTTSFIKDLLLLALILVLFVNKRKIDSSLATPLPQILLLLCIVLVSFFQMYVLEHLPLKDCLGFKKGANILENMKVPAGGEPVYSMTFKYKKDGKVIEYSADSLPEDLDSTYEFVDRYDKLIKKGIDAKITDFALTSLSGADTTEAILSQPGKYFMVFVNALDDYKDWYNASFDSIKQLLQQQQMPLYIVTSNSSKAQQLFGADSTIHILVCDGTVIKTAARVNPTYFVMQGPVVKAKYSYRDADKAFDFLKIFASSSK